MGWLDAFSNDHAEFHNEGSLTHDALAGGLAYEIAKHYEDHLAKNGKPDSHAKAKELLAGFAAAAVTQLAETKGRDAYDAYKKKKAIEKVQQHVEENFTEQEFISYNK